MAGRNLKTKTLKRFRGQSIYESMTALPPEFALETMNVLVSASGALGRLVAPVAVSPAVDGQEGPWSFKDFQYSPGGQTVTDTPPGRALIAAHRTKLYSMTTEDAEYQEVIDTNNANCPRYDMVDARNFLFLANGVRMLKYDAAAVTNWGIRKPGSAATLGVTQTGFTGSTTEGSSIITLNVGDQFIVAPGDAITIAGAFGGGAIYQTPLNGSWTVQQVLAPGIITIDVGVPADASVDFTYIAPVTISTLALAAEGGTFSASRVDGIVTITCQTRHKLSAWARVTVAGMVDDSFNGDQEVTSIPSDKQFCYANAGGDATTGGGTFTPYFLVSDMTRAGGTVTATVEGGHPIPLQNGDHIRVSGSEGGTGFDGDFVLLTVESTIATWAQAGADDSSSTGKVALRDPLATKAPTTGTTAAGCTRSNGIVTVETGTPHGCVVGGHVSITAMDDASFNGIFPVLSVPTPTSLTYANGGSDGTTGNGYVAPSLTFWTATTTDGIHFVFTTTAGNYRDVEAFPAGAHFTITQGGQVPDLDIGYNGEYTSEGFVSDPGSSTLNAIKTVLAEGLSPFTGNFPALGNAVQNPASDEGPTFALGARYRYAWKNSTTGHVGTASDPSESTGPVDTARVLKITPNSPDPEDPQVDTVVWFRTLDGGADFFLHSEVPLNETGQADALLDTKKDADLDTTVRAPLLNDPPPPALYLTKWQGRLFGGNLPNETNGAQMIFYTGYEKIRLGRPEESVPPLNRLKLAIGADEIAGIGAVTAGIVAFSKSNEMYQLRGAIEDISVDAPVQFSEYLEELPWENGCAGHFTIAAHQYGLTWLAADFTIQLWDGAQKPVDISGSAYPLLQTITRGKQHWSSACHYNWLDRNWYVLVIPTGGHNYCDKILFFDLEPNPDYNVGWFQSDIQADFIGAIERPNGERWLCISQGGYIKRLEVQINTWGGLAA